MDTRGPPLPPTGTGLKPTGREMDLPYTATYAAAAFLWPGLNGLKPKPTARVSIDTSMQYSSGARTVDSVSSEKEPSAPIMRRLDARCLGLCGTGWDPRGSWANS